MEEEEEAEVEEQRRTKDSAQLRKLENEIDYGALSEFAVQTSRRIGMRSLPQKSSQS
jgi:hypothetical protein